MSQSQSLPMGALAVAREGTYLRTLLGSCIGLVLFDRNLRLAGLAHIVLPNSNGNREQPGKYSDTAVPELLRQLQVLAGGSALQCRAKIAGGAKMFAVSNPTAAIGQQNIDAVQLVLNQLRIPIVGRHLGGEQGRRLTVDSSTGSMKIEIAGMDPVTL